MSDLMIPETVFGFEVSGRDFYGKSVLQRSTRKLIKNSHRAKDDEEETFFPELRHSGDSFLQFSPPLDPN